MDAPAFKENRNALARKAFKLRKVNKTTVEYVAAALKHIANDNSSKPPA